MTATVAKSWLVEGKRVGRRAVVLASLAVVQLVVTEAVLPVVTGLASVRLPAWLGWLQPGSTRPWWVLGLVLFLALMAAAVQARVTRSPSADADPPPPSPEPVPEWVVGRPAEASHAVTALTRRRRGSRGATVGLTVPAGSVRRRWRDWSRRTGGYGAASRTGCTG